MNEKILLRGAYRRICNYNLFMRENNVEREDPTIALRAQKYATWIYVLCLLVSLYILFYIAWTQPQSKTIKIPNITPTLFVELSEQYGKSLSCPCTTISMPYKAFILNTITFHPLCTSIFVRDEWIQSLYTAEASMYGVRDFRSTAASQFQLLASFCSLSKDATLQSEIDLNNVDFVSSHLLSDVEMQQRVNGTIEFFKKTASTRTLSFLNYLRATIRANFMVSALNTNFVLSMANPLIQRLIYSTETKFIDTNGGTGAHQGGTGCCKSNPLTTASLTRYQQSPYAESHVLWIPPGPSALVVAGFFTGCIPLEAVLQSSLDCLYESQCLQLLTDHFPGIQQDKYNWTVDALRAPNQNVSVYEHLSRAFVDDWSTEMNYSAYFEQCTPKFCTYTTADHTNFSFAITLLISLYGGLILILRMLVPMAVKMCFKLRCEAQNTSAIRVSIMAGAGQAVRDLKQVNLFETVNEQSEDHIRRQRTYTRVFLLLLIGSLLAFILFTLLHTTTITLIETRPSVITYNALQAVHAKSLKCPCANMIIPHQVFLSLSPVYHRVCSSDFVTDRWLTILEDCQTGVASPDWRDRAFSQFRLLSELCNLTQQTVDNAVQRFLSQSFITSNVLSEEDLRLQLNVTVHQFYQTTIEYFDVLVGTVHTLSHIDQPYYGAFGVSGQKAEHENPVATLIKDEATNKATVQVRLQLTGPRNVMTAVANCVCATDSRCHSRASIYDMDRIWEEFPVFTKRYELPGIVIGCSATDSLMLSTLECYHVNSSELPSLLKDIKKLHDSNAANPSWFNVHPLTYDPATDRFPPNASISTIMKEMMIERWNFSVAYRHFYQACAPAHCIYSQKVRGKSAVQVLIDVVSMISGLTLVLRVIVPRLVQFFMRLWKRKRSSQRQRDFLGRCERLRTTILQLIAFAHIKLVNLNVFGVRDFSNGINRARAQRLGQWSTRLYFLLFAVCMATLTVYTLIQPRVVTHSYEQPPATFYEQLYERHGDELICSCSSIDSTYDRFVQIKPVYHEICRSPFASQQDQLYFTATLGSNLSAFEQHDYRRFLRAHLQFLAALCQLSDQAVAISMNQFLSSPFATNELLPAKVFHARVNSVIKHYEAAAPQTFTRILRLIRSIQHGNAIVSSYGSNFEYIVRWTYAVSTILPTRAMIYDSNCTCGLQPNCTSDAHFVGEDKSTFVRLEGLKIGCTPSESFRASTLECFYDPQCIERLRYYTQNGITANWTFRSSVLATKVGRFATNTTVAELIDHLFVEEWMTMVNYSLYYDACAPLACSYIAVQRFDILYIVTFLLGVQGGLNIVLMWICPKLVRIALRLRRYRKRRTAAVCSVVSISVMPAQSASTTELDDSVPPEAPRLRPITGRRRFTRAIIMCTVVLSIIAGLALFSIYSVRSESTDTMTTTILTSTTTFSTITHPSTTTNSLTPRTSVNPIQTFTATRKPACPLQFQTVPFVGKIAETAYSGIVADFNGDLRADLAFLSSGGNATRVFLGNGDGTFGEEIITATGPDRLSDQILTADFNNDHRLDIVITGRDGRSVVIILGNGDGTFKMQTAFRIGDLGNPLPLTVADFNNDGCLDLAASLSGINQIRVFLGKGDGTFSEPRTLSTQPNSFPFGIATGDFNLDNYEDIVIASHFGRNIEIFLGHGNGTFGEGEVFSTGSHLYPFLVDVNDFNNDRWPDVAVSYKGTSFIGVMLGFGDGSVGESTRYTMGSMQIKSFIATADFNGDDIPDIGVGYTRNGANVLISYGNGSMDMQEILVTRSPSVYVDTYVADFNGDGHSDIFLRNSGSSDTVVLLNKCA